LLDLEVLPAVADQGSAVLANGRSRNQSIEVTPEGVMGGVHHGEVDPVLLYDGHGYSPIDLCRRRGGRAPVG
jgi:hypothetical protein